MGSASQHNEIDEVDRLQKIVGDQCREINQLRLRLSHLSTSDNNPSIQTSSEQIPSVTLPSILDTNLSSLIQPALERGLSTKEDVAAISQLCRTIIGTSDESLWQPLVAVFFEQLVVARNALPPYVLALEYTLPADWFQQPWYTLFVNRTALDDEKKRNDRLPNCGTFDTLREFLPFIRKTLGFQNVCLLPHYESPMADGGNDVSSYTVRRALGGLDAFERFMRDARALGIRIGTYGVYNHVSTEHDWFQRAINGEMKYLRYFVLRNGREKIAEYEHDDEVVCQYCDPDGTTTERVVAYPDMDRTHGLWVEVSGKSYQFYRSFFPHEIDLNLRNPDVLIEVIQILGAEVTSGVLCKRMSAVSNWVKVPGQSEGDGEICHAILALFKYFLRLLHARTVMLADGVRDVRTAGSYTGTLTVINGELTLSGADGVFVQNTRAGLFECVCLQSIASFWKCIFSDGYIPDKAKQINVFEDFDELRLQCFPSPVRRWLRDYIQSHSGAVFNNGLSAAIRLGDVVGESVERAATALFLLYLLPGIPMLFAGTELCLRADWPHARCEGEAIGRKLRKLGVYMTEDACFDRREVFRGPIPRAMFDEAFHNKLATLNIVCILNRLFTEAFREKTIFPVDSKEIGVLAATLSGCGKHDGQAPIALAVANLTPLQKLVHMPIRQVKYIITARDEDGTCYDFLSSKNTKIKVESGMVSVVVAPFGRYLFGNRANRSE